MARRKRKPWLRGKRGRFVPSREVEIVTRKEQPIGDITVRVGRLERRSYPMAPVSSSNVSEAGYDLPQGVMTLVFTTGKTYGYFVPFEIWEQFYYAHSKGTFVWKVLRGGRRTNPPYNYWGPI